MTSMFSSKTVLGLAAVAASLALMSGCERRTTDAVPTTPMPPSSPVVPTPDAPPAPPPMTSPPASGMNQ